MSNKLMTSFEAPLRVVKFNNTVPEISRNAIEGKYYYAYGAKGVHIIDISNDEMAQKCFKVDEKFDH